jgi:hypothetical protein
MDIYELNNQQFDANAEPEAQTFCCHGVLVSKAALPADTTYVQETRKIPVM